MKGKPTPQLKWSKDGAQLTSGGRVEVQDLGEGRHSLTIEGALLSDDGTFRVMATNPSGSVTSKAIVTVSGMFFLLYLFLMLFSSI